MLNQMERWILYYDMMLRPTPKEAPDMPIVDALGLVEQLWNNGEAYWLFQNESAALRIQDMKFLPEKDAYILLFSFADKNISDPVFSHFDKGTLRVEPKLEGEGVALSSHMVISTKPRAPGEPVYLTLLEDVPRVGRTNLRSFITSLFKRSSNFEFTTENGNKKKCRPTVELDGHMDQRLKDDLAEGASLLGFELVQYKKENGDFDEEGFLEETKRQVVIDVKKKLGSREAVELANRLMGKAKNSGYHDMRVRYRRPEGKQKTIMVGTHREDAGDALSVRSELVKVPEPLAQCSEAIRYDLADRMVAMLDGLRG